MTKQWTRQSGVHRRSEVVKARLSLEEALRLDEACVKTGLNVSELIRRALRRYLSQGQG
jgi:metal-responsive CopG/Arc/MetJ family transcriptional regulator